MLSVFARSRHNEFNLEESTILISGIIARYMKDGADPTLKTCRTNAMDRIVSDAYWGGVTKFGYDCCKS